MTAADAPVSLEIGGQTLSITHPGKLLFPAAGVTKLDLVHYYLAVAEARCAAPAGGPV